MPFLTYFAPQLQTAMLNSGSASKIFIFVVILVDVIGLGVIIPVVPDLIVSLEGGTVREAAQIGGWLMFAFAIVQFFAAPVLGELSDRFGRKPLLLMALFGLGADYLFHAFAPTLFWLFVGRVLAGFFGASYSVAYSYMADVSKPEDKAKNFGLIGAAFGLGFIIGPALGGVAGEFGVRIPFFIAAGLSFINLLFGIFVLPESLKVENRRKFEWKKANPVGALVSLSKYPSILGLIAAYFLVFLAGKSVETVWTYYTMHRFEWSTSDVGWSLALVGILVTIVQGGLIGKAVKSFGQKNTILYGYFFWVTGLVLFGVATQGWMMYAFTVVYCLGGVAGPTIQGVMSNQVPANQQGELQGANASLISITSIIGPPLFTGVFTLFTSDNVPFNLPGISFFLGAVLAIISAIIAFFTLKNYQGQ